MKAFGGGNQVSAVTPCETVSGNKGPGSKNAHKVVITNVKKSRVHIFPALVGIAFVIVQLTAAADKRLPPPSACPLKTEKQWEALERIAAHTPRHLRRDFVRCAILRCLSACERIVLVT